MASSESEHDLCIIGSGIAAMLCAERAVAGGRQVLMLERGHPYTHADRLKRKGHADPLPFNTSPQVIPHGTPGMRPYVLNPVYNLGGSTNHFFGNLPRIHPVHFDRTAFGGEDRRWPIRYAALEPYYLSAEQRLQICGNSERTPFPGKFAYPLPPHRLSPSDRACESIFGADGVMQVPTVRPSRAVDGRPACCASDDCGLCPVDSKGTALNMVYPGIRDRIQVRTSLLAVDVHVDRERVEAITAIDPGGVTHRIRARQFVVAANGVDSCLLLQRSRDVPKHAMLGRCYMDHPSFELAIYGSGLDARPGYGDSAQTGMITTFFEEVGNDLPVSMLGEIRLTDPLAQNTARSTVVREVTRLAMEGQYSRAPTFRERFDAIFRSTIYLKFLVEMQPSRENTLSIQEINATGQAQPRLAIHLPTYFDECERRVKASIEARLPGAIVRVLRRYSGEQHWMGATRMANDPRQGCVDENLRYHGLENLWVLSASTFPSCSSANPTLTLSALALRLGDHLAAAPPAGP